MIAESNGLRFLYLILHCTCGRLRGTRTPTYAVVTGMPNYTTRPTRYATDSNHEDGLSPHPAFPTHHLALAAVSFPDLFQGFVQAVEVVHLCTGHSHHRLAANAALSGLSLFVVHTTSIHHSE